MLKGAIEVSIPRVGGVPVGRRICKFVYFFLKFKKFGQVANTFLQTKTHDCLFEYLFDQIFGLLYWHKLKLNLAWIWGWVFLVVFPKKIILFRKHHVLCNLGREGGCKQLFFFGKVKKLSLEFLGGFFDLGKLLFKLLGSLFHFFIYFFGVFVGWRRQLFFMEPFCRLQFLFFFL